MSAPLIVCAGCYRHVRASERACPFCRAALDAPPPASRTVAVAVSDPQVRGAAWPGSVGAA